jgi:hypothetical protein
MLYQYGVGLAFLATVRRDGGPRVHPICPLVRDEGLFAFLLPSPKRADLIRDPRYALHSFPAEHNEDAFYLAGSAWLVDSDRTRGQLQTQFLDERRQHSPTTDLATHELFEFGIERCLHTVTTGHGDPSPNHIRWSAPQ